MNGYFDKQEGSRILRESNLPVQKKSGIDWEIISGPNRYKKKYKFKSRQELLNFIADVMQYENEIQHHAEITIRYKTVTIIVWTHTLNDITEVDREYVRMVNEIYKDNDASTNE